MLKVFIDTNIFISYFKNDKDADHIALILDQIKRKNIIGYTSSKTLGDLYYLVSSYTKADKALNYIKSLYSFVEVSDLGAKEIREAIALGWTDFEDAMQMSSAKSAHADIVVTLDKSFQKKDPSIIWSPYDLRTYIVKNINKR